MNEFCIAFASAVTQQSPDENDLVAKDGEVGLFATLAQIFPQVTSHQKVA